MLSAESLELPGVTALEARISKSIPDIQTAREIRALVPELRVGRLGASPFLRRSLPGITQAQSGGDGKHITQAPFPIGLYEHPGQPGIQGQTGHEPALITQMPPRAPGSPRALGAP